MKFHELLHHREELLRQARLANVAYAYQWLADFTERVSRSGLRGEVTLRGPDPEAQRMRPELVAGDFSQAVVEEHFLEDEVAELAVVLAFLHDAVWIVELKFRLEELATRFLPKLRRELKEAGVLPGEPAPSVDDSAERDAA